MGPLFYLLSLILFVPLCAKSAFANLDTSSCPTQVELMEDDGPYDYRERIGQASVRRKQIEGHHFNADVRALRQGQTGNLGADLDFVLRYFPNHHEALNAMMDLSFRTGQERPKGARKTVICYFEYAKLFTPDDSTVRTLYGIYLLRNKRIRGALSELERAVRINPADANAQYNLGLIYVDLGEYDKALEHAHAAYQLGFPLKGLRNKLERAGRWRDQSPTSKKDAVASAESVATGR